MRYVQALLNWILLSTGRTDLKRLEREREIAQKIKYQIFDFVKAHHFNIIKINTISLIDHCK